MEGLIDELNALHENAAARAEEKELQVFELEEQIERVTAQLDVVQKGIIVAFFFAQKLNLCSPSRGGQQMGREDGQ